MNWETIHWKAYRRAFRAVKSPPRYAFIEYINNSLLQRPLETDVSSVPSEGLCSLPSVYLHLKKWNLWLTPSISASTHYLAVENQSHRRILFWTELCLGLNRPDQTSEDQNDLTDAKGHIKRSKLQGSRWITKQTSLSQRQKSVDYFYFDKHQKETT